MAGGKPIGTIFVELDLDKTKYTNAQNEILQGAISTSTNIEKNWSIIGQKSDLMYDAMRQRALNAYEMIAKSGQASASEIIRAEEAKNARIKQINEQQYGETQTFMDKLKKNWAEVVASVYIAYRAFNVGKELINASLDMERITMSMKAVAGNTTLAAKEIQFLREESNRLGLNVKDATTEYIKFAAAAKNTSIEGEETRKIFSGMSEAITALKLTSMDANLIYMAMTQMISKGIVSMEELRRQMGERLPGAIRMAAEGMGISTKTLIANIESGKVMATDLLPKLAEQLHKTYGKAALEAAQGGQAAINRFNNALFETKSALGDSLMPAFTDILNVIKEGLPYVSAFVGGIKIISVEIASWHMMFVARTKEERDIYKKMAEDMKREIASPTTVSSQKTLSELASEQQRIQGAKKAELELTKQQKQAIQDIADKTMQWSKKIEELNPQLNRQDREMQALLADAEMLKKTLRELGEEKNINVKDAIAKIDAGYEQGLVYLEQKKNIDSLKLTAQTEERRQKEWEQSANVYEEILKEASDYALTVNEREIQKIINNENEKLGKLYELYVEKRITLEELEKTRTIIETNAAKARLDKEVENNARIASINASSIENIIGMEQKAFDLKVKLIEAEKRKRIKDGGDAVLAEKWKNDQIIQSLIELGKKSDSVMWGMQAGLMEYARQSQRVGGLIANAMTRSFDRAADSLADFLIEGEMNIEHFLKSMAKDFAKIAIQSAITGPLAGMLGGLFGTAESSSVVAAITSETAAVDALTISLVAEEASKISLTAATVAQETAEASVTATMITETSVVDTLTFSYLALAAAKEAAGMSGGGEDFGFFGGLFHSGGIVGETPVPTRRVPSALFADAPRLHFGLRSDEFPAILQKGETVIPKGAKGGRAISIINNYSFHVAGSMMSKREFVRDVIPLIEQEKKRGAH